MGKQPVFLPSEGARGYCSGADGSSGSRCVERNMGICFACLSSVAFRDHCDPYLEGQDEVIT